MLSIRLYFILSLFFLLWCARASEWVRERGEMREKKKREKKKERKREEKRIKKYNKKTEREKMKKKNIIFLTFFLILYKKWSRHVLK